MTVIAGCLFHSPKNNVIADFGCGKGRLAESLPSHKVHSFDLIATKSFITACNFAMVILTQKTLFFLVCNVHIINIVCMPIMLF